MKIEIPNQEFFQKYNNPAAMMDMDQGIVLLNPDKFFKLPESAQAFIIAHELAHYYHDTRCEFTADEIAFKTVAKMGLPLSSAIKALTEGLSFSNPEHLQRVKALYQKALSYDQKIMYNQNLYAIDGAAQRMAIVDAYIQEQNDNLDFFIETGDVDSAIQTATDLLDASTDPEDIQYYQDLISELTGSASFDGVMGMDNCYSYEGNDGDESLVSLFGKKKKPKPNQRKQRREDRRAKNDDRKQQRENRRTKLNDAKAESKVLRGKAVFTKANAKQILAEQGIAGGGGINVDGFLEKVAPVAGKLLGSAANAATGGAIGTAGDIFSGMADGSRTAGPSVDIPIPPAEEKKDNTWLYVGIGAGLLIVGLVLFFVLRKKE